MICIGSKAMLTLKGLQDTERFERSDIDVCMTKDEFNKFVVSNKNNISTLLPKSPHKYSAILKENDKKYRYEIELDTQLSTKWLTENELLIKRDTYIDPLGNSFVVPSMEILFLTKKSHIYMPIHFAKNVSDYLNLYEIVDHSKLDDYSEYYNIRHKEVKERSKKSPRLSMTNEDFFDRSKNIVGYIFEHDDIHQAIKHYEKPVYEMMKKDYSKAWCEKDMFNSLPHEYKIRCVQEEAYVIALERYIILQKRNYKDPFLAYKDALARICTTLCSGFFREFALHHYNEIINAYNSNYLYKFQYAVDHGLVHKLEHIKISDYEKARESVLKS